MLNGIYFLIYNFVLLPPFYLFAHILAIFNAKLRQGLIGRYQNFRRMDKVKASLLKNPVLVLHCSSMGEFEHTKPFLLQFKKKRPDFKVVVLFFSPSGFENVKSFAAVDLFLYAPNEWGLTMWRFMKRVKPALWIVAKHDVWPNQIWFSRIFRIPVFLINASLHEASKRITPLTLSFHKALYRNFTRILVISEADKHHFLHLIDEKKLQVVGDTKYDQVIYRRDESKKLQIIPEKVVRGKWIIVAGSTWPADQSQLIPAVQSLESENRKLLTIICPHEPTQNHLDELTSQIVDNSYILLSEIHRYTDQSFILVDRIGVLANLYGLGNVAYVGGSFKQNVHNVLEAAVYRIPVLFGPVNQNSHEAQLLKANQGGFEVRNAAALRLTIERFIRNDIYRQECGLKAFAIVEQNLGATIKTIQHLLSFIPADRKSSDFSRTES